MTLSGPVTWTMLVRGRLVATTVGVAAILAAAGGGPDDRRRRGRRIGRPGRRGAHAGAPDSCSGPRSAAVAAIAVAVVRRSVAVTVLAVVVGASYLLAYLVPVLGWPDWLNRISVFWAFGHPYLRLPPTSGLVVLVRPGRCRQHRRGRPRRADAQGALTGTSEEALPMSNTQREFTTPEPAGEGCPGDRRPG